MKVRRYIWVPTPILASILTGVVYNYGGFYPVHRAAERFLDRSLFDVEVCNVRDRLISRILAQHPDLLAIIEAEKNVPTTKANWEEKRAEVVRLFGTRRRLAIQRKGDSIYGMESNTNFA